MPASSIVKNLNDGSLTLTDATGSPVSVTVKFENGDFSISGLAAVLQEVSPYQSRGKRVGERHTARVYPTFSFTAMMSEFSAATAVSLSDAILKNGAFVAGTSQSASKGDLWTLDAAFTVEGSNFGDASDHTLVLEECYMTIDFSEGDPNTFTINGTVYGAITGDLNASTP